MAGITDLIPSGIIDKSGDEITSASEKFTGKVIGLYFSAHWFVFHSFICCSERQ